MRIIAGEFRSRRIVPPRDQTTRPITDRVKEALFNRLREHTEGAAVLDLFAGTGSIGLEAISRGADRVVFVERDREAVRRLKQNIETLGVADRADVVVADALSPTALTRAPRPVHLAFLDPPYPMLTSPKTRPLVLQQMSRLAPLLDPDGFLILRAPWPLFARPRVENEPVDKTLADLSAPGLIGPESHDYNNMALHFYQRAEAGG